MLCLYKQPRVLFKLFCLLFGFLSIAPSYATYTIENEHTLRDELKKALEEPSRKFNETVEDESKLVDLDNEINKIIKNLDNVMAEISKAEEEKNPFLTARLKAYDRPQALIAELCIAGLSNPKNRDKNPDIVHSKIRGEYAGTIGFIVSRLLTDAEKETIIPKDCPDIWFFDANDIQQRYSLHTQLTYWGLTGPSLPTSNAVPELETKTVKGENWISKQSFENAVARVVESLETGDGETIREEDKRDDFEKQMKVNSTPLYEITEWLPEKSKLSIELVKHDMNICDYWDEDDYLHPDLMLALLNWPKKENNYKSQATLITCVIAVKLTGRSLFQVKSTQNFQTMGVNRETATYDESEENKNNHPYMIALCLHNLEKLRKHETKGAKTQETKEAKTQETGL
ncbi:hypothetical protein [Candidatus Sororendozoicomonas aggregata]|uniref:hypothetical protein n=1 Tax=Candidatus Sororendozoicomonas aggregata TaxID=3073239 RepID=UPI002ED6981B